MPCLVGALALFFPRLAIILVALFSDYIGTAFNNNWLWPVLGFFFMPLTVLGYAFAIHNGGGHVHGLGLVVLILAILIDLGIIGGNAAGRKKMKRA